MELSLYSSLAMSFLSLFHSSSCVLHAACWWWCYAQTLKLAFEHDMTFFSAFIFQNKHQKLTILILDHASK